MIGFLLANLFLLGIVAIVAGYLWLVGATLWFLGLPPDEHPAISMVAGIAALFATYYTSKWLHGLIERQLNKR